ncbi:ketohydroxyglutarate aldolase [Phormidesmis priestleyi ULC007]|uniref:Ketohydroxyglutarate aldolase n=1 Tax=Phormidesmis priestleyi ULC007 TaxID=1920490 RepID=A0A2T1D4C7_9CYAN|nr:hypothetical protein [Phormidesmis priestleyi]PSB15307.1 ketohydroxyglutarate aldolase [Phormidesmis priestleyi ULC007]
MANLKVLVSVRDDYQERLPEVAQKLQTAGMQVDQWLVEIGVITGAIAAESISALSQIEGVADIELAEEYQLAPPESDLQ